jgi:hypothetical protein
MELAELQALRRTMHAFIRADSLMISFTRIPKQDSGNGGWVDGTPEATDPQEFRLVPFKRRLTEQEKNTQDGDIPYLPYVLVGHWDADVQRDDTFTFQDRDCIVVGVEPKSSDTDSNDRIVVEFEMR